VTDGTVSFSLENIDGIVVLIYQPQLKKYPRAYRFREEKKMKRDKLAPDPCILVCLNVTESDMQWDPRN
jgi:hypothetical protein